MPMEISYFEPHIENLNLALETVSTLCKQPGFIKTSECESTFEPLMVQQRNIVKLFGSISHLIDNRSRRGAWIGGIGTVLKTVFGTLDENDAFEYDQAIHSVQENQKNLLSLIKNNILVTNSVISTFNNSLYKVKQNEIKLNNAIGELSLKMLNLTNTLALRTHFDFILNTFETSMVTLSFQLEDIINAIMFCSQNILHPAVVSPTVIYRELADNMRHFANDLNLPMHLDISSIHLIVKVSTLLCYYFNYKLVFLLRIPLVSNQEYTLFNNIELPTPHNINRPDIFSLIVPSTRYIAITKDKSNYCTLESLENCKILSPAEYLCDIPIIYKADTKPNCESELISKTLTDTPLQCNIKFIFGKLNIFKPLSNNRYLYVQSEPLKLSLDCQNDRQIQEINIVGIGILSIPNKCVAYCKGTTLLPKYHNILNLTSPIKLPDFNLINSNCCSIHRINYMTNNLSHTKLEDIHLKDINHIQSLTSKLLSEADKIRDTSHIVKYGIHYSIATSITVCIIILYLSYKIILYFCKPGCNLRKYRFCESPKIESSNIELEEDIQVIPAPTLKTSI